MAQHAGDSLEAAARYARGSIRPGRTDEESPGQRSQRAEDEANRLAQWAEEIGKFGGTIPPDAQGGLEHTACFDEQLQRWIKSTRPGAFGQIVRCGYVLNRETGRYEEGPEYAPATPVEYLDRISLANELFHDDIRIERVVPTDKGISIVTSQPNYKGEPPNAAEIDRTMVQHGFEKITGGSYYLQSEKVLVSDLFPKNAVLVQGHLMPVDTIVQRAEPDFIEFLKQHSM